MNRVLNINDKYPNIFSRPPVPADLTRPGVVYTNPVLPALPPKVDIAVKITTISSKKANSHVPLLLIVTQGSYRQEFPSTWCRQCTPCNPISTKPSLIFLLPTHIPVPRSGDQQSRQDFDEQHQQHQQHRQDVDDADFEDMCSVLSIQVPVISIHSVFSVYQPDLPPPMLKPGHAIDAINEINDISEDVEEVVKVPTEAEFVHPPTSPQQVSSLLKSPLMNIGVPPKVYPRNSFRLKFLHES